MSKDPAFLWYSKDWIEGTAELSLEEKGMYADLLSYQHQRGKLPREKEKLARMVRVSIDEFERLWPAISDKFVITKEGVVNRKLESVMAERSAKSTKNKLIGTFGHVINSLGYSAKQKKELKFLFDVNKMMESDTEWNTERLSEWCKNAIPLIEDEDEKENTNKFVKPDIEQVQNYFESLRKKHAIAEDDIFGESFVKFYDSKGWKIGKEPMKDWKGAVFTWVAKRKKDNGKDGFMPGQKTKQTHGKERNY